MVYSNSLHYVNNRPRQAIKLLGPGLPEKANDGLLVQPDSFMAVLIL